jgi:hypothetical protein
VTTILLPLQGANIGRRADQAQTRANIKRVRHADPRQDLEPAVGWQEVNDDNAPVDERDLITETFPADTFTTWPRFDRHVGALVPVTLPLPWRPIDPSTDQWAHKISDGEAGIQPDRFITVRIARHPDLPAPLAVVSWQNVQGAYTDPGQSREGYRRASWAHQWHDGIVPEVTSLVRDGITVAYAADTNRPRCPLLRWDDHRVLQAGIDALGYVPGRGRHALSVDVRRTWDLGLNIDGHRGTGALLALS